jgi:hypothetical protein
VGRDGKEYLFFEYQNLKFKALFFAVLFSEGIDG